MATRVADLAVPPDRVMLDTNVLLAATDEGRAGHHDALTILNDWPAGDTTLYVSGQILREYLAVATRPADRNGLGLKAPDALGNVAAIRERTTVLAEGVKVTERLLGLLADVECGGRQVHDANVIATMLVHGVGAVVTMNLDDFARFGGYVDLLRLLPARSSHAFHSLLSKSFLKSRPFGMDGFYGAIGKGEMSEGGRGPRSSFRLRPTCASASSGCLAQRDLRGEGRDRSGQS